MGQATAAEFPASNERERLLSHFDTLRPLGADYLTLLALPVLRRCRPIEDP